MESKFSRLRQRDTSVSMLRVKMSRRKSQSQKENRERLVNNRRRLDKLPELDISSLNASISTVNMSIIQEKTKNDSKPPKTLAQEERLKRLVRWKEQKALEKEKEKREKGNTGVFKTGVYQPKDKLCFTSLPVVPPASSRHKEKKVISAPPQSSRITRSMKQQQLQEAQKPLAMKDPNIVENKERSTRTRTASVKPAAAAAAKSKVCAGYPAVPGAVRALSTRSALMTLVTKAPVVKDNPKPMVADVRTTRSKVAVKPLPPSSGQVENCKDVRNTPCTAVPNDQELKEHQIQEPEKPVCPEEENNKIVAREPEKSVFAVRPSFAPKDFVFQAPAGLSSFQFEPLSPHSADAFLTPSSSFNLSSAPALTDEPQSDPTTPAKTPQPSPPHTSPTAAPLTAGTPPESKRDVPYFRSEIANETDRLRSLCLHWEPKVEDESIPEEMRNRMRTAVGQARLLMKERFNQFSGLVDDCELGRGEKITTCMDLQGFWDMVYFQVEDVNKKFDALKEAESRGWVEEDKPPPRQRKVIKKPPAAATKPTGAKAAAKSRLAAVKAAMRAKQQAAEAEKAATDAANTESPKSQEQQTQTVVFDGGFFQVESPIKPPVRRSSRLSAVAPHQASPCPVLTPRRVTRRSLALARTPARAQASPAQPVCAQEQTPAPQTQDTHQACQNRPDTVNASLHFSPVKVLLSDEVQSEQNPTQHSGRLSMQEDVSELDTQMHILPVVSVETEENTPADSPKPSLALCNASPSFLSFTLSPCRTPDQTPSCSAAVSQQSVCHTPDGSTTEAIPGLDFERYLQPSQRCSITPMDMVADEVQSEQNPTQQSESLSMQEDVSELGTAESAVSVEMEENTPADSPKPSLALCKTPTVLHAPPSSFTLSFCETPDQTPTSSAAVSQQSVCHTPDGSTTEEIPGLDFERYLQPSQRCSITPMDTVAVEMSPLEADVVMESPRGQPEEVLMEQEPAQSAVSPVFSFPSPQTAESNLLLFTPDPLDRIRESVCPSDLMVFTPPRI